MSFEIEAFAMKQIILHIPHSSAIIPIRDGYTVRESDLKPEIMKLTDWFTNDLFQHHNALQVVAPFSRIFCDVERQLDDAKEPMASYGMGFLYTAFDDGKTLRKITPGLKKLIINQYYQPFQSNFLHKIETQLRKSDSCLIIDCHAFTGKPLQSDLDKILPRPDINIGTDDFHTSPELISLTQKYFKKHGLFLRLNSPSKGTFIPEKYFKQDKRVQGIRIELNRDLYLRRDSRLKSVTYPELKQVLKDYLEAVHALINEDTLIEPEATQEVTV